MKKLGEVAEIGRGKSKHRPRDAEFLFGGKYPFIQTGDIRKADLYLTKFTQTYSELGLKQSKLWDENTLCITIAANIAETAILKIKACFPDSIIGLIPKEDKTIVLFVKHLFDKFKIQIQSLSQGAAQDNLNQEKLSKIRFAFPSLPEQKRIASFLSLIDERIETQNKIIEELKVLKSSISKKLFSQQLRFKDNNGNNFPDWKIIVLGEIGEIITGKTPSTKDLDLWDGDIQFVTPTDINDRKYQQSTERTIKKTAKLKVLPPKSIMFTCIASIGKMSISLNPSITNQQINSIIPYENCDNEFLYYAILNIADYIKSTQSSSTLPIINKTEFSKFEINFPCIEEQIKIAIFLSTIDEKIEIERSVLQQLENQKQYLLSNLFI